MRTTTAVLAVALLVATAAAWGAAIPTDAPPYMTDGRVMVPMRAIFEWVGAGVSYDEATRTISAERGEKTVELRAGERMATMNGEQVDMGARVESRNGRTFVPLRFVAEAMGADVEWDAAQSTVIVRHDGATGTLQVGTGPTGVQQQEQDLQSDATEHLQVETPPTVRPARASDGQITIQLDRIERGKRLPTDVVEQLEQEPFPRHGRDLVAVLFRIVDTDTAYITRMFDFGANDPSVLLTRSGERYEPKSGNAEYVGLAGDDFRSASLSAYLSGGSTVLLIFEVPENEELVALRYTYGYKTSEEDVLSRDIAAQRGQVELPLTDS